MSIPVAIPYGDWRRRSLLETISAFIADETVRLRDLLIFHGRGINFSLQTFQAIKTVSLSVAGGMESAGARLTTWSAADETLAQFQRTIVPQLDAAYNFARFLSRDPDAAQDIVQNAFLKAYRGFEGYRGGDARAWIFSIVRNCFHDWLVERRRKANHEIDAGLDDDSEEGILGSVASDEDTPETAMLRKVETESVRAVLLTMPRTLREVLILRELEGLSYKEIADITTLPIGTVMSRLARARKEFANAWSEQVKRQENES